MPGIDLRESLNAISDVVNNRPAPLREFDQIYMKTADMLLHAEHASRYFDGRRVVFVGDGDAIGLCLVHLKKRELLPQGPAFVHILDFDERVVLSVRHFAKKFEIEDLVTSELYNVAEPLPESHWRRFDAFHTNPPFGQSNEGRSIEAFLTRCLEAVAADAVGCAVLADDRSYPWTQEVLRKTQRWLLEHEWCISELLPEFHGYHLDDAPDLKSCSLVVRRSCAVSQKYESLRLEPKMLENFYGLNSPLRVRYVRDKTNGGKLLSNDHYFEGFE